jgi:hypothetical protein
MKLPMPKLNAGCGGEEGIVAPDHTTAEIYASDTDHVIECDLLVSEDRLPVTWPVSVAPSPSPNGLTAVQARAQDVTFVKQCSLSGLADRLPLLWPAPSDTPPSPKNGYRSHYVHLGWQDLHNPSIWEYFSDFDLLLRLVDFGPLRPVLAQLLGWTSARGHKPFDPISIFLLIGWQITNKWNRAKTLRHLRDPRYADYVEHFGFEDGVFPTEGGLRHWLTTIGQNSTSEETIRLDTEQPIEIAVQHLNNLIVQSVRLLVDTGFVSLEAWLKALLCPDGMIHDAASRMRCISIQETCYQPTSPDNPRPCPAKEKDRQGCDCDTTACISICQQAPSRDSGARYVWYTGSNQPRHSPNLSTDSAKANKKCGQGRYGFRSTPLQLAEFLRRFGIVLLDDFLPANAREENYSAALLLQLATFYPDLCVDAVAGDAGFGYAVFLSAVYNHLHARRVIDLRAHESDKDKADWLVRRYNDKGRPLCTYGYTFRANGFDFKRQRYKWVCAQTCLNGGSPVVLAEGVSYPPNQCPHSESQHYPFGDIINVGERFENDSIRLVRDIPVGSPSWKRLYHRARNAVEGRNAAFEHWGLKQRMPVYGSPRGKAVIFLADVWLNLSTLARLVREATAATGCF